MFASQLLSIVLEPVEEVRFVVLLPDSDALTDVPHASELLVRFVAEEDLSVPRQFLLDALLRDE